jgi:predicted transcriptional regulator
MKDPYEEERLAKEMAMAAAELRKAMEEGVQRGWFYAKDDATGQRAYGLTDEGKRAMERGELG